MLEQDLVVLSGPWTPTRRRRTQQEVLVDWIVASGLQYATQTALGAALGVSRQEVSRVLHGIREMDPDRWERVLDRMPTAAWVLRDEAKAASNPQATAIDAWRIRLHLDHESVSSLADALGVAHGPLQAAYDGRTRLPCNRLAKLDVLVTRLEAANALLAARHAARYALGRLEAAQVRLERAEANAREHHAWVD